MQNKKPCTYCKKYGHTSIMCFEKPRRRLKHESEKHRNNRQKTRIEWLQANPPNAKGLWFCYLRISPNCPGRLTESMLTLEHVKPKGSNPELRHDIENIKPSCQPCNLLKGSRSLESLGLTP